MIDEYENYAPLNNAMPAFDGPDYSRDNSLDLFSDPYAVPETYYYKLAMRQWKVCASKATKKFFSVTNIKRIQRGIRREIYNRSYSKFRLQEDQNVLDLILAMLEVYRLYGKNLPYAVVRQVKILNEQTVEYIAGDMMTNLKQQYSYLNDIKNPIDPIALPLNLNHAGRTILPGSAHYLGI